MADNFLVSTMLQYKVTALNRILFQTKKLAQTKIKPQYKYSQSKIETYSLAHQSPTKWSNKLMKLEIFVQHASHSFAVWIMWYNQILIFMVCTVRLISLWGVVFLIFFP